MGNVMQWYLFGATVSAVLINSTNADNETPRFKRANAENFDILLNIYKMNPLKESNVFKTFSNTILLPRPDGRAPDLNFDSNESTKEKRIRMRAKFKQIEDAIHVTRSKTIAKRPSLNIQERITSFKDIRHKVPIIKDFTHNQNNMDITSNYDVKDLEWKKEKTIGNAGDINKNNSSGLNVTNFEITHKSIADINSVGFDTKMKLIEIGFDNNGIAVMK